MTPFTPLTPIAKEVSSNSATQSLPRIPQNVALPQVAPVLEKTLKTGNRIPPKAITAPTSVSNPVPVGFNPPVLEKVSKTPSKPSTGTNVAQLRPSWPESGKTDSAPVQSSTIVVPGAQVTRVEDPEGLYVVTCEVFVMGCDKGTTTGNRKLLHGVFSYAEVMKMQGDNLTNKLVSRTMGVLHHSLPPFLQAGINLGTVHVEVKYPLNDITGQIVATIELTNVNRPDMRYRTITIRRLKANSFVSLDV